MPRRPRDSSFASEVRDDEGERIAATACRTHLRGFYFAGMFLPQPKRNSIYVVGAFLRMITSAIPASDAASGCGPNGAADSAVALLKERLDDIYEQRLEFPQPEFRSDDQHVLHAFATVAQRYAIPRELFIDFAQALRDDAAIRRYPTWSSLEKHCDRTGGSIARALACVLGVTHSDAGNDAAVLGKAVRFTQILGRIPTDWSAGKLYLPLEDMVRFRFSEKELSSHIASAAFKDLMSFESERARSLFQAGSSLVRRLGGDGGRAAVSSVMAWHMGILDAIRQRDYDVLSRPVELTLGQRLRAMPRAWKLLQLSDKDEPLRQ